jgi:hypothetical protein
MKDQTISGRDLVSHWSALDWEKRTDMVRSLIAWLRAQRLSNYGYDRANWQRLQRQRAKAKKVLGRVSMYNLASEHRLAWSSKYGWEYTVGQSCNEEITNLINRLAGYPLGDQWLS